MTEISRLSISREVYPSMPIQLLFSKEPAAAVGEAAFASQKPDYNNRSFVVARVVFASEFRLFNWRLWRLSFVVHSGLPFLAYHMSSFHMLLRE